MSKDAVLVGVYVLREWEMGAPQVAVLAMLGPGSSCVHDVEVVVLWSCGCLRPSFLGYPVWIALPGFFGSPRSRSL